MIDDVYQQNLANIFGMSHSIKFFAGSLAGVTAVMTTYPLDLVRARLAFAVSFATPTTAATETVIKTAGPERFRIIQTISHVFRYEGGFRALYKGLSPTILAMVPHAGKFVNKFDTLNQW